MKEELEPGFPTWRYHRTKPACIVHSSEELDALGEGWVDTPAKFKEKAKEVKREADDGFAAPKVAKKASKKKASKKKAV
tara:strand:- start:1687 stop:1923 length:237 start_codon:yes stop_codon:yes gene_type:complete